MNTLIKVSWRNVWRNKVRSGVLVLAIAFGLCGGLFAVAFSIGLSNQHVRNFIQTKVAHVQLHHPEYPSNQDPGKTIEGGENKAEAIRQMDGVQGASARIQLKGMIRSPGNTRSITISGVNAESEKNVSTVSEHVKKGTYLSDSGRAPIIIGQKLADKLGVNLGSRVVLQFQGMQENIASGAFKVQGIFSTNDTRFDKRFVFVRKDDLEGILGEPSITHEIAVFLKDRNLAGQMLALLNKKFPDLLVRDWKTIAPELAYIFEYSDTILYIYMVIIMAGLAFGIVNTMLMAILERIRELGMLMAIGMKRSYVFGMVLLETVWVTLQGSVAGILLGWGIISYYNDKGIALSGFSEGLKAYGISDLIYPELSGTSYGIVLMLVVVTAFLSAIYPAIKAINLNPAEAVRKL